MKKKKAEPAGQPAPAGRRFFTLPLVLTAEHLAVAVAGAYFILESEDSALAEAAEELLAKVEPLLPGHLQTMLAEFSFDRYDSDLGPRPPIVRVDVDQIRVWIKSACKIRIGYSDSGGSATARTIWPVDLAGSWDSHLLSAWCELRKDFRQFRTERIVTAEFLDEAVDCGAAELRQMWKEYQAKQKGTRPPEPKTKKAKKL